MLWSEVAYLHLVRILTTAHMIHHYGITILHSWFRLVYGVVQSTSSKSAKMFSLPKCYRVSAPVYVSSSSDDMSPGCPTRGSG